MNFIFDPSLVLYLPLNEKDGSSFTSGDAYGHLCTVTGALWRLNGRYFDGVDDYIALPASAYRKFADTDDFTIIAWANSSQLSGAGSIVWLTGELVNHQPTIGLYFVNSTRADAWIKSKTAAVSNIASATDLTAGWLHLVVTWQASLEKISIFANGVFKASDSTNSITFAGNDFNYGRIGCWGAGVWAAFYKGLVGEVYLYKKLLSMQEIQNIYLATKWRYQ